MPEDARFSFNEPEWVFPTYGFILLGLAFAAWKIWRIHTKSESVRAFLFSLQGFPFLLLILLGLAWLYWAVNTTYTGFWTLHIVDVDRLALDYWFPRADRVVQPQDIREFTLVTTQKRSKGKVSNRQWAIVLIAQHESAYRSVPILREDKAKQAISALEHWAGRPYIHYLRDCSDPWGVVCTTSRMSSK